MAEKVDQAAREAAANWYGAQNCYGVDIPLQIAAGLRDDDDLVQAFAAMKEAGRQQGIAWAVEFLQRRCKNLQDNVDDVGFGIYILEDAVDDLTALMEGEGK